ncbi:hypothetical protein M3Y99_01129800 [Aphelenchoides fujianensis]|nr:hypothetical protein M3Y99_01129800 [Aphelenchoides fujianensis]
MKLLSVCLLVALVAFVVAQDLQRDQPLEQPEVVEVVENEQPRANRARRWGGYPGGFYSGGGFPGRGFGGGFGGPSKVVIIKKIIRPGFGGPYYG